MVRARTARSVRRDGQIRDAIVQDSQQCGNSAARCGSLDRSKTHVTCCLRNPLGIAVLADQKRDLAMAAEVEHERNVLVPEDEQARAFELGQNWIGGDVVVGGLVIQHAHPSARDGCCHQALAFPFETIQNHGLASLRAGFIRTIRH